MTKEELEKEVLTLEKQIEASKTVSESYQTELETAQKQLKDYNKIALPPSVFDEIVDAIERGIDGFDFNDNNNYDTEFSLDYDNRVQLDSLYLNNSNDLGEMIMERISEIFTEMETPEDEEQAILNAEDSSYPTGDNRKDL